MRHRSKAPSLALPFTQNHCFRGDTPMAGAARTKRPLARVSSTAAPAAKALAPADYLRKILNAKVYDVAIESPLDKARTLSRRLGNQVLLKREDMQPVFSFKLRGAYNKMAHLSAEQLKRGVICASAGNHAQGVAMSAAKVGCRAVIVMPTSTPGIKIDAFRRRARRPPTRDRHCRP
jgi:threonine dehydratase